MVKYNRKSFINEVKENGGVNLENDLIYVCLPATTENFKLSDMFVKQLVSEGKYGYYVRALVRPNEEKPYSQENLPIYGDPNKYVTKWLYRNIEDAIERDLRERSLGLLKRANAFKGE